MTPLFHHDPSSKVVQKHYYDTRPTSSSSVLSLYPTAYPETRLTRLVQPSSLIQPTRPASLTSYPPRRAQEIAYYSASESNIDRLPSWLASKSSRYAYSTTAEVAHRSLSHDLHSSYPKQRYGGIERYGERHTSLTYPDRSRSYIDTAYAYRSHALKEKKKKKIELERRGEELVMVRRRGRVAERGVEESVEWVRGVRW
jgi:hypothetical protein